MLAEARASRSAGSKATQGAWRLPLVLNVASQLVLHIHHHHYFVQLCMHDPKRSSGENRVSKIATTLCFLPALAFLAASVCLSRQSLLR